MSYRKILIDKEASVLLDFIKNFSPDLNVSEILHISLRLFGLSRFSVLLDGEMTAKFNGQEFDLKTLDGAKAALKVAHELLNMHLKVAHELLNMHDEQTPP